MPCPAFRQGFTKGIFFPRIKQDSIPVGAAGSPFFPAPDWCLYLPDKNPLE